MSAKSARAIEEKFSKALNLHRQGKSAEARKLYVAILKARPKHPGALHFLGFLAHQSGDSEAAVRLMRAAIQHQPDYADAIKNLGNVMLEKEQFSEAESCYRRVIGLKPADATAYSNLCVALRHQDRFEDSISAGRTAVKLVTDYPVAWFNLGNTYKVARDYKNAIACYEQAIRIDPKFSPAHDSLCQSIFRLEKKGFLSRKTWKKSIRAYEHWLQCEPDSPVAAFMLKAISGDEDLTRAPDTVIRNMFNQSAPNFEHRLNSLEYKVPDLIKTTLQRRVAKAEGDLQVLDAGCGTGLCAPFLKPYSCQLTGVDLSAGMLEKARSRNVYDELVEAELTSYLVQQTRAFDLIVFADTLCYFGDLAEIIAATAGALRPNGMLVFSVERLPWKNDPKGYRLHPHGRYSHSQSYVDSTMLDAGFDNAEFKDVTLRMEIGEKVAGFIVSAVGHHAACLDQ